MDHIHEIHGLDLLKSAPFQRNSPEELDCYELGVIPDSKLCRRLNEKFLR